MNCGVSRHYKFYIMELRIESMQASGFHPVSLGWTSYALRGASFAEWLGLKHHVTLLIRELLTVLPCFPFSSLYILHRCIQIHLHYVFPLNSVLRQLQELSFGVSNSLREVLPPVAGRGLPKQGSVMLCCGLNTRFFLIFSSLFNAFHIFSSQFYQCQADLGNLQELREPVALQLRLLLLLLRQLSSWHPFFDIFGRSI